MIMPLSATKPRKKCAICKYWDGEKPELPVLGVYLIEKENEGGCLCESSSNCNTVCGAMQECECFELDSMYFAESIIVVRENITTLQIPKQVDSFPAKLFCQFENLEEIVVDEENIHLSSVDGVLFSKDKKTLLLYPPKRKNRIFRVPDELTSAVKDCIKFGTGLDVLDIGMNTMLDVRDYPFCSCEIKAFVADDDNNAYYTEDGVLYSKDMSRLIVYPNGKEDVYFEVPIEVECFCGANFRYNGYLRNISIHKNCDIDIFDIMDSNIDTIHIIRQSDDE